MPKRKRYLWVCTNERAPNHPTGSCARSGSRELLELLKKEIALAGLKQEVRACGSTCLDVCWHGNVVALMPDHVFYGHVTEADVAELVQSLKDGTVVQRLRLPDAEFDPPATREG